MLNVSGLLLAYDDVCVTTRPFSRGSYFTFYLHSQNTNPNKDFCVWRCNMYVPIEYHQEWLDKLSPGNVFYLMTGFITADPKDDGKPFPSTVCIEHRHLKLVNMKVD